MGEAKAAIGRRFAADPAVSRGRRVPEAASPTRSEFQRDRDRIIHSTAFRRLKDKTQVFVFDEGDHYRTRLTHTIEVAQIARSLARGIGLDEDLAETLALAHDLGHPPFGHSGEDTLDACMADHGGFDHNAQSLRVVTRLERRYAAFDGLNLTWETLEGLVKHNGPLLGPDNVPVPRYREQGLPHAITVHAREQDLWLWSWPSAEAQVAAIADDIAYDAHDIDDGVRSGLVDLDRLAAEVPLVGDILVEVDRLHPGTEPSRRSYEVVRRVITRLIEDVSTETLRRLATLDGEGADAVRRAGSAVVAFSDGMAHREAALKRHLFATLYRAERVMAIRRRADRVLERIFGRYMDDAGAMPEPWRRGLSPADGSRWARRVCDFVAGMTDRFALLEHERLFDEKADLR
jgi:dGTPase